LAGSNDEGIEPKETEQMIDEKSLKVLIEFEGSEGIATKLASISTTDQVDSSESPISEEANKDDSGENWNQENGGSGLDVFSS